MKVITTSWDDGHALDGRLAALLYRYNLKGTFYVPKTNAERCVMQPSALKELATGFEIGGHTLSHVRLSSRNKKMWEEEISGCYQWIADVIAKAPRSFCFPGGVVTPPALKLVFATGFDVARTTALFDTSFSANRQPMKTTLQVFAHSRLTYTRHLVKRQRWTSLVQWLKSGSSSDLLTLAEDSLNKIEAQGGCFHLWGHSWEIEEYNLWQKLEALLQLMANRTEFTYLDNGALANAASQPGHQRASVH